MDRQLIIDIPFIVTFLSIITYRAALFMTSLSTMLHLQPLLWRNVLYYQSILLKNKELKRDEYITGLLEVTLTEGYIMEEYT